MGLWEDVSSWLVDTGGSIADSAEMMRKNFSDVPITQRLADIPGELAGRAKSTQDAINQGDYSSVINMSPVGVGSITPPLWKTLSPESKAATSITANMFPGLFGKVLNTGEEVIPKVAKGVTDMNLMGGARGLYTQLHPASLESPMLGGGYPKGQPVIPATKARVMSEHVPEGQVLGHELQHHVTDMQGKVQYMNPTHARENAVMMLDLLPDKYKGSMINALKDSGIDIYKSGDAYKVVHPSNQWTAALTHGERKSFVSPEMAAKFKETREKLGIPEKQYHPNAATMEGQSARVAHDEMLSYLGNAASDPKTTTPELRKLAEYFGVDWKGPAEKQFEDVPNKLQPTNKSLWDFIMGAKQ